MKLILQIAAGAFIALAAMHGLAILRDRATLTSTAIAQPAAPTQPATVYLPAPGPVHYDRIPKPCQITTPDGITHYCNGPLTDPR
jgi:hypothetical protein